MRPNIDVNFIVKECPCFLGGKICVIQYFFVPLQSSKNIIGRYATRSTKYTKEIE